MELLEVVTSYTIAHFADTAAILNTIVSNIYYYDIWNNRNQNGCRIYEMGYALWESPKRQ